MLATAAVRTGAIAADIGCGSGFITEGLIHAGLHVIAVDQSEAMLAEMKPLIRRSVINVFCGFALKRLVTPKILSNTRGKSCLL